MLSDSNKKILWRVSMLPFLYNFMLAPNVGLHWFGSVGWLGSAEAMKMLHWFHLVLPYIGMGAIAYLFVRIWRTQGVPMPAISALMLVTNAIWWFVLSPMDAFVWATIFHGIQYLAIVIIFHVKDQKARPDNFHGTTYHVLWFYGASLALGYGLFNCVPRAYMLAGFGPVESILLVVAAINIHHFVVDAFIWRLKKTDTNRQIVDSGAAVPT